MKKRNLLLSFIMVFCLCLALAAPAWAFDIPAGTQLDGDYTVDANGFHLYSIDPKLLETQEASEQSTEVAEPNFDAVAVPFGIGVTRIDPKYLCVYPIVDNDGEPVIVTGQSVEFYVGPTAGTNYIGAYMKAAERTRIKGVVKSAGYTQLGWYFVGRYYVETYNPIGWYLSAMRASGTTAQTYIKAANGNNDFEVISAFVDNDTTQFTLGVKGTVKYISNIGENTSTQNVGLYVYMQ